MRKKKGLPSKKRGKEPKSFSYQGRQITLLDPGEPDMPMLSIDGLDIMVRREETGGYAAPMLNMFVYATQRVGPPANRYLSSISRRAP